MSRRRAPESSVDSPLWPAVEEWLAHLGVERGLSANTTSAYRRDLVAWVEHLDAAGRTSWPSVQAADVRQHLAGLTASGRAQKRAWTVWPTPRLMNRRRPSPRSNSPSV